MTTAMKTFPTRSEDSVTTKPGWQGVSVDETDRYRGNERREHAPKDRHGDIGGEHDRNGWRPDNGEAANRENDRTGDEQRAVSPRFVDPSADRGVQHDAGQAAYGQNSADRRLAPMCISEEVDVNVSAKAAPHVGEEEIHPIKSNEPHEADRLAKNARTSVSTDEQ
jgi:hypothetical protein